MKNINKDLMVFSQFIIFIILVIMFLMSFFIKELLPLVSYLTGILLIIMAINNIRLSKNKFISLLYGICGILVIILEIFNL